MKNSFLSASFYFAALTSLALGQGNGKLQLHFMDVGQGDGAVLISPLGEVVLFHGGNAKDCNKPVSHLLQLAVKKIDYAILSHYHADHFGCATEIFSQSPLQQFAYDRGGSYNSTNYKDYIQAVGQHRRQATENATIILDKNSANKVTITFVALNGDGISTTNENDLSIVSVIDFGGFRVEIGGDLSGFETSSYKDIEKSVAPKVGEIDVYKVHHHCSAYSTNDAWLNATKPTIAIVSAGVLNNDYGHPTLECLERLHNAGVKTYWTEVGKGAEPDSSFDTVAGTIVVENDPATPNTYSVRYGDAGSASYAVKHAVAVAVPPSGGLPAPPPTAIPPRAGTPQFAWSKGSPIYHLVNCRYVGRIEASHIQRSDLAPPTKTLHPGCPTL